MIDAQAHRRWNWPALIGVWSVLVLASTTADAINAPPEWPFERVLLYFVLAWGPWIPMSAGMLMLPRRMPLSRVTRVRVIGLVLGLSLVWSIFLAFWMPLVQGAMFHRPMASYFEFAPRPIQFKAFYDWSLFIAVAVVVYTLDLGWRYMAERERVAALERELRDAKIDALQAQLRPHFLFNTLNAATAYARTGDGKTAARLLEGLSELLRYALETGERDSVPLSQELEMAENYLTIQSTRFADRLEVVVGDAGSARDLPVPPMILQPLVENAVVHGAEGLDRPTRVVLEVRPGVGEVVVTVRNSVGPSPGGSGFGVGLDNVRAGRGAVTLRVMIVDDEGPARANLRAMLSEIGGVAVVAEAASGADALEQLSGSAVDLLLLDIQMPGTSGIELARTLEHSDRPRVIFVTAHSEFALDAFGVAATDYLLKPVTSRRLAGAIERVRSSLTSEAEQPSPGDRSRFVVRGRQGYLILSIDLIDWIEGSGNYLRLWSGGRYHLYRGTLSAVSSTLPPGFVRIHRSAIVNSVRVREVRPMNGGNHSVVLADGTELTLARRQRQALELLLADRVD